MLYGFVNPNVILDFVLFFIVLRVKMLINIGPQHPSTHGVLRLLVILNGEIINWISYEIGYLHRGSEKLIESNFYNSSIGYFDRFDYVSTISQELLFIHSLERLLGNFGSLYSSYFRTLFLELFRILNHCLAITTHAIDIGLFTTMLWTFEEREKLLCFIELISGTRFHALILFIGRLRYDISLRFIDSLLFYLFTFIRRLKEIYVMLSLNSLWNSRLFEIGIIDRSFCLYYGLSGLLARSCYIFLDARLFNYEFYDCINYHVYLSFNGDCLDRYFLRFNEIINSCFIIYSLLFSLFLNFSFTFYYDFKFVNLFNIKNSICACFNSFNLFHTLFNSFPVYILNFLLNYSLSLLHFISLFLYLTFPFLSFFNSFICYIYNWISVYTATRFISLDYVSGYLLGSTKDSLGYLSSYNFMELVIYEFNSYFPFILSFIFALKLFIEMSKGIYSIFIMNYPLWTTNIISSDYIALTQINKFCRFINLADLVAILGSIDFVLGSVDL